MPFKGSFKHKPFCVFFSILGYVPLTEIPSSVEIENTKFNLIGLIYHQLKETSNTTKVSFSYNGHFIWSMI
jgi:hypothetical protein